MLILR